MLEEGRGILTSLVSLKDLKALRRKLKTFTKEFEDFFEDAIQNEYSDLRVYMPTKKLVNKYFI